MSLTAIAERIEQLDALTIPIVADGIRAVVAGRIVQHGLDKRIEDTDLEDACQALNLYAKGDGALAKALDALNNREFLSFAGVFWEKLGQATTFRTVLQDVTDDQVALALRATAAKLRA